MVDAHLPGNGVHAPLLDEVMAQDLCFQGLVDHRISSAAQALTADTAGAQWTAGSRGAGTGW